MSRRISPAPTRTGRFALTTHTRQLAVAVTLLATVAGSARAQSSTQDGPQLAGRTRPQLSAAPAAPAPSRVPHRRLPAPEATYATPGLAARIAGYYDAKSAPDSERVMSYYSRAHTSHNDAVLGWTNPTWQQLHDLFAKYMPGFGTGVSYATRVLGDERSGIVYMVDTPELFGGEILAISAYDFDDAGKITRVNDYWDARNFGAAKVATMKLPASKFPATFGEEGLPTRAAPEMQQLVARLSGALAAGRAGDVAALLSDDVVFEDFALRAQVRGKAAATRYLERAITTLPYAGPGAGVRHVVGSARGGGYEWTNARGPVPRGITAIGVGRDGRIAQLSTVYDAAYLSDDALAAAQRRTLDFDRTLGRK